MIRTDGLRHGLYAEDRFVPREDRFAFRPEAKKDSFIFSWNDTPINNDPNFSNDLNDLNLSKGIYVVTGKRISLGPSARTPEELR